MKSNSRTFMYWLGALVAVIGAAASVAVGYVAPQSSGQMVTYVVSVALGVIGLVLVAVLSAWLLGTWRSLWIVPAAYFLGWLAANMIGNAIRTPQALSDPLYYIVAVGAFATFDLVPLLIGVAIGTALAKRADKQPIQ